MQHVPDHFMKTKAPEVFLQFLLRDHWIVSFPGAWRNYEATAEDSATGISFGKKEITKHTISQKIASGTGMTEFIELAKTTGIPNGTMVKVSAGGRELLIARVANRFYCTDNSCPHFGGDLSAGVLDGTVITCPMHHSRFDLNDGHVIRWTDLTGIFLTVAKNQRPPRPLRMYPVRIEGDKILAAL